MEGYNNLYSYVKLIVLWNSGAHDGYRFNKWKSFYARIRNH